MATTAPLDSGNKVSGVDRPTPRLYDECTCKCVKTDTDPPQRRLYQSLAGRGGNLGVFRNAQVL